MKFENDFEHSAELFTAALEEFTTQGYDQASINTILNKAGMSKGQFYYHFQNKEGLYLSLVAIMIGRKQQFLDQVKQHEEFQAGIFSIFKTQVKHSMAFAAAYPEINRFAESFLREKGNPIYDKALAIYNFEDNQAMNQLIEAAYHNGDFRQDLPLPFIKKTILYLFAHSGDIIKQDADDEWRSGSVEEDLNNLVEFMKNGLSPAAQPAAHSAEELATAAAVTSQSREAARPAKKRKDKPRDWDIWQS